MVRKHKIIAGAVAALILILVVAVVLLATMDWNRFKPYINEKVSDALGRPFAINGDLRVEWERARDENGWRAWMPWAHIAAQDIAVGNPDWASAPQFASLDKVDFRVGLLPLLSHRVVLRDIQLGGPAANLERLRDGRANWQFKPKEKDTDEDTETPSDWQIDVHEIAFDKGRVAYRDEQQQADLQVVVDPLGKPISIANLAGSALPGAKPPTKDKPAAGGEAAKGNKPVAADKAADEKAATGKAADKNAPADKAAPEGDAAADDTAAQGKAANDDPPAADGKATADGNAGQGGEQQYVFGWSAKGKYKGLAVDGDGKVGGMLAMQDAEKPFPLEVNVGLGQTKAAVEGTLTDPMHLGALDLRLKLSGASMADLYPLIGVALPDTPPYSTDGHLVARMQDPAGAVYQYQDFNGKVGDSDIHGDLTYTNSKPRPSLQGQFRSELLRFADLGPLVGADTGKGSGKKSDSAKVAQAERASGDQHPESGESPADQPPDKALPVQEFRTERWKDMDADVTLKAKRIVQTADLPLTNLQVHVIMRAGVLSLTPLRFGMAGGNLDADIRLDGSKKPMPARAKIKVRKLQLKQLFPKVESMRRSLGELNGDAALTGTGNSVAALLASANGETKLLVNDGVISASLMELAGLNVANYVVAKLFGDEEVAINCAAADISVKDGLATPSLFVFDTENAIVDIGGSVDFKTEKLDLDIAPHSKGLRIISLRSPLYVNGTLKDPKAGVKVGPLVARGAGMVALGALLTPAAGLLALIAPSDHESENQCSAMLREIQKPVKAPPPKGAGSKGKR